MNALPEPTAEQVQALKAKHPDTKLHQLSAGEHTIVVRGPTQSEWGKFRRQMGDPQSRTRAAESLVRDCLVHPAMEAFESALSHMPALAETFGAELMGIAGLVQEVQKKVL